VLATKCSRSRSRYFVHFLVSLASSHGGIQSQRAGIVKGNRFPPGQDVKRRRHREERRRRSTPLNFAATRYLGRYVPANYST